MAERHHESDGIDGENAEVLSQDHFEIGRGKGEQELVGSELPLLGPYRHRERGDEEHQEVGKDGVQGVQVREVVEEEPVLPEGRGGAQENEEGDEYVARGVAEVHPKVALHDRPDDVPVDLPHHDAATSSISSRVRR